MQHRNLHNLMNNNNINNINNINNNINNNNNNNNNNDIIKEEKRRKYGLMILGGVVFFVYLAPNVLTTSLFLAANSVSCATLCWLHPRTTLIQQTLAKLEYHANEAQRLTSLEKLLLSLGVGEKGREVKQEEQTLRIILPPTLNLYAGIFFFGHIAPLTLFAPKLAFLFTIITAFGFFTRPDIRELHAALRGRVANLLFADLICCRIAFCQEGESFKFFIGVNNVWMNIEEIGKFIIAKVDSLMKKLQ